LSRLCAIVFMVGLALNLTGCLVFYGVSTWQPPGEHRRTAEQLRSQGDFTQAIAEYHLHIAERLRASKRAADENPHFYLLYIGDCYLELGDPLAATEQYLSAHQLNVSETSITDRLLRVANWYGARGRYEEALELLDKHREIEPLIFESQLDTFSKLVVQRDEGLHAAPQPTPSTDGRSRQKSSAQPKK